MGRLRSFGDRIEPTTTRRIIRATPSRGGRGKTSRTSSKDRIHRLVDRWRGAEAPVDFRELYAALKRRSSTVLPCAGAACATSASLAFKVKGPALVSA